VIRSYTIFAGAPYVPESIRVPFYKTIFTNMHSVGEAGLAYITFQMLKDVNNLRNDKEAVVDVQYFVHIVDRSDLFFNRFVSSFSRKLIFLKVV
jgi:hypothetical protein